MGFSHHSVQYLRLGFVSVSVCVGEISNLHRHYFLSSQTATAMQELGPTMSLFKRLFRGFLCSQVHDSYNLKCFAISVVIAEVTLNETPSNTVFFFLHGHITEEFERCILDPDVLSLMIETNTFFSPPGLEYYM